MVSGVSVIIPNYNNAHWLPQCIESCLQQGEKLGEVIIVDDHSTDNSLDVIRKYSQKYPSIVKLYLNPCKGANAARNFGFEQSTGDFIQWLDSDDFLLPGKFDTQVDALVNSGSDIAYSDFRFDYYIQNNLTRSEIKNFSPTNDYLFGLIKENWNAAHSYLIRRSYAEKLHVNKGWNPETKVGQDREYFTMAGILGAKFHYVPGVFAVYNKQDRGTISGMDFLQRLELNQKLENRFREEIRKSPYFNEKLKKKYLAVLDTHLLKACFYHPGIRLNTAINPVRINWKLMHWKMRMVMPFVYIKKHLELYF